MNKKFTFKFLLFLMVFAVIKSSISFSQITLKFRSNSASTSASGPTTSDQLVKFNVGSATTAYTPTLTATYSLSNQQYTSVAGNSSTQGVMFGASNNANGATPASTYIYQLLNAIGNGTNAQFSTNGVTPSIDVASDYGILLDAYVNALINLDGTNKVATNTTNYFADLIITFNRPVNNPIIHFAGLGGFYTPGNNGTGTEGFSMGFDLASTGYSLTRLSGSTYFGVNGVSIRNTASQIGSNSSAASAPYGAAGSVQINGTAITTLIFHAYVNGDGGGTRWAPTNQLAGDNILISVSLAAYTLSGTIFDDTNGLTDNTVNGVGSNAGGLNAVLIDSATNTVIATAPVNSDGTYTFNNNVAAGKYSLEITAATATIGSTPPPITLPNRWAITGENIGSGAGSDGTPDGVLKGVIVNGNITAANFGIDQIPTATTTNKGNIAPWQFNLTDKPGYRGILSSNSAASPLSGNDPEDGAQGTGNTFIIQSIASSTMIFYNGQQLAAGDTIKNYQPNLLAMYGSNNSSGINFSYSSVDRANIASPAVSYALSSPNTLPVFLTNFIVKSINCEAIVNWTGAAENNFSYYEVQQSINGNDFTKVEDINGKGGGSNYSIQFALTSNGYIRLEMVDKNGSVSYSDVLPVNSSCGTNARLMLYPNPVINTLIIDKLNTGTNNIQIVSINGSVVYKKQTTAQQVRIDVRNWASGIYIVSVSKVDGKTETFKIIK